MYRLGIFIAAQGTGWTADRTGEQTHEVLVTKTMISLELQHAIASSAGKTLLRLQLLPE